MNNSIHISWNNYEFSLLAEKAIYWKKKETLFIADTHFGKAATFRNSGIPVPEKNTSEDCIRLSKLIQKTNAKRIIFLGDFFHARIGKTDEIRKILLDWRNENQNIELYLIRGNHDINAGDPWIELNIKSHPDPSSLFELECRHLPSPTSKKPHLAGHIHPGFSLSGKGKSSIRAACFHITPGHIILPAFGSFTGLKNIKPEISDEIYITNGEEIFKIPTKK